MSRTITGSSSHRNPPSPLAEPRIPATAGSVRATLGSLGVRPSRSLGQSFLVDPFVADAEAALLEAAPGQPIVEIGGGLGLLSEALGRRGLGPLTVLEKDPRLARHLARALGDRAAIVEADALEFDFPAGVPVVGNLPFSVATPILLRLLARRTPRIVALVQQEVAERFAAEPGRKAYGRLSILARLYGEVRLYQVVPARSFCPVPEVSGRILVHSSRPGPLPVDSTDRLESVVRLLFSSRRKKLKNLLARAAPAGSDLAKLAASADWPVDWGSRRPEELPPEAYFRLAQALGR